MNQQTNGIFGDEQKAVNIREKIGIYLTRWPLFLICLILGLAIGLMYTYYAIPKYIATTTFLIKGEDGGKSSSADLVEVALGGKKEINLSNEIVRMRAASLMRRTVRKYNFNIAYYLKGRIHSIEVYDEAPFTLLAKQLTDSNSTYELQIQQLTAQGGNFLYGTEKDEKQYTFQWNKPFTISGQSFMLAPKRTFANDGGEYIVRWSPVPVTAGELSRDFGVKSFDPETSILEISLKTENLDRGRDILNALIVEFNLTDIEARRKITANTFAFINDRLDTITNELRLVETDIEKNQVSNQTVDIKAQTGQSLANVDAAAKAISGLNVQQGVTRMMADYIANPANDSKLIPASLGVADPGLTGLLARYNDLQLKIESEKGNVTEQGEVMQNLKAQTADLKNSILQNLNTISKNLNVQAGAYQQQRSLDRSILSSVPRNTRVMQEIQRKQGITEGIYLYLFEKREEVAISGTADDVSHYIQIDPATGYGPVEPNKKNILLFSALLGLFAAFGWVYVQNLLNNKIVSRDAITRQTNIPLLGQIAHIPANQRKAILVTERSIIGEQFRAIRTNLSFMIKDKTKKVIMVTSTVSGEGKSFISLNLAAVYAVPGKKVALLEFDIRQPVLTDNLQMVTNKGITNYLSGEITDISELYYTVDELPKLHVYPCGPTLLNPADLLLADTMNTLFENLRAEYDYVIVDSPPAGLVTDPFILGGFSDVAIYIVRNQKTTRKQIDFVNDIVKDKTLNNVTIILNDVKKADNYGYGYGSDANYGYYNGAKKKKKYSIA